VVEPGTFITPDGERALIATQAEGVLATRLDTDEFPVEAPYTESSGRIAIYTGGEFLWPAVRNTKPGFVFDQVSIDVLKKQGITLEAAYVDNRWARRP